VWIQLTSQAMATYQACQVIGLPECRINLAVRPGSCSCHPTDEKHCVAYLAEAPKSTRAYTAYNRAATLCDQPPLPGVPLQIRNAPTRLMKQLGYGKEYAYNPDYAHPVINVCFIVVSWLTGRSTCLPLWANILHTLTIPRNTS
jgi:putative ATPase